MNKKILIALLGVCLSATLNSCKENEQVSTPETSAELKKYQLSVPLEDGRTFIEFKSQEKAQVSSRQTQSTSGFNQISTPDQAYLSSTTRMGLTKPTNFSIINCVADQSLKLTFTDSVMKMPGYPNGWTAIWNTSPDAENQSPIVLYTRLQNRLTIQLSKYVKTFGFELAPNLYNAYPFAVGYYDSKENPQVAYLQEVATTPGGAKLFAVTSDKPFNVIEISYALGGENISHPYGFAIANIRYSLAK